jgi:hypothetical protein
LRVIEVKNEYAIERKEQHDRTLQISKAKVYTKPRVLVILENYSDELAYIRKRPITL